MFFAEFPPFPEEFDLCHENDEERMVIRFVVNNVGTRQRYAGLNRLAERPE